MSPGHSRLRPHPLPFSTRRSAAFQPQFTLAVAAEGALSIQGYPVGLAAGVALQRSERRRWPRSPRTLSAPHLRVLETQRPDKNRHDDDQ